MIKKALSKLLWLAYRVRCPGCGTGLRLDLSLGGGGAAGGAGPAVGDGSLLEDGTIFRLLEDGTSFRLLE
jgi:hypothetical protein